jgi:hypothetical protein
MQTVRFYRITIGENRWKIHFETSERKAIVFAASESGARGMPALIEMLEVKCSGATICAILNQQTSVDEIAIDITPIAEIDGGEITEL